MFMLFILRRSTVLADNVSATAATTSLTYSHTHTHTHTHWANTFY